MAQDVGFEPLLKDPNFVCYHYTTSCMKVGFQCLNGFPHFVITDCSLLLHESLRPTTLPFSSAVFMTTANHSGDFISPCCSRPQGYLDLKLVYLDSHSHFHDKDVSTIIIYRRLVLRLLYSLSLTLHCVVSIYRISRYRYASVDIGYLPIVRAFSSLCDPCHMEYGPTFFFKRLST